MKLFSIMKITIILNAIIVNACFTYMSSTNPASNYINAKSAIRQYDLHTYVNVLALEKILDIKDTEETLNEYRFKNFYKTKTSRKFETERQRKNKNAKFRGHYSLGI